MTVGLPVSRVVSVSISLTPLGAAFQNFDTLLILGDSDVIDTNQRIRTYNSITGVAADFATTSPEYLAAVIFFAQTPQPTQVFIGRWAKTATHGTLQGGVLSSASQVISLFTGITNGTFAITIDGMPFNVTGLNFSSATNLNGVASTVQTALRALTFAAPTANGALTQTAGGTLAATTYYVRSTYVTPDGETTAAPETSLAVALNNVLNVASPAASTGATGWNVYVSTATGTETKQNGATPIAIGTAFVEPTSGLVAGAALPTSNTAGPALATFVWNSGPANFTLKSGITGTTSTLGFATSTGTGTDVSAQLLLTSALAQYEVNGIAAETAVAAVTVLDGLTTFWYALMFAAGANNADVADSDYTAVAAYVEASGPSAGNPHIFGITTSESAALSSTNTTDIGSLIQTSAYQRTFYLYSTASAFAVAGMFGKLLVVDFAGTNTMLTLMWKQLAGVAHENLTATQAGALDGKRYNYYTLFNNGVSIIVNGMMGGPAFVDEIFGMDALANRIQTDVFNLMVTSLTKIPQTDPGVHEIIVTAEGSCAAFVTNGYLAPGTWTSAGFGTLKPGDVLSRGYYVYAIPVALQAVADRAVRKSPTIQIAAKEAGAIHNVVLSVAVNR